MCSLHGFRVLELGWQEKFERLTHGPIITLAPGIGSCDPSIEVGTRARYSSSSRDSFEGLEVYQEPAWLADLVVMVSEVVYEDDKSVRRVLTAIVGGEGGVGEGKLIV